MTITRDIIPAKRLLIALVLCAITLALLFTIG